MQDLSTTLRQWCRLHVRQATNQTILSKCTLCRRYDVHTIYRPGPPVLPKEVAFTGRPFQRTGVDYKGAISVKDATNGETFKVYIALFTCMVTRAVYLQVASDLSAETFLNVFRQFAAVCSLPRFIVSDQGTNLC